MKLISATVRNYRIHRETTVDFDESRTLIGGANETGKSTFIEAIHRALFLKATVTGDARTSMESTLWPGHPEVELRFVAQGDEYHLVKRFGGQTGTTRLTMMGGSTWQGEEAQARLSALLGVAEVGGGRGILERVSQQWGHLWVWQGSGGDDPADELATQQARLFQQLQQSGGAVVMQSALDSAVASRFARVKGEIFTMSGASKRGSDLELAQREVSQLQEEVTAARARVEELREAAREYEEAQAVIAASDSARKTLARQLEEVANKVSQVQELRAIEERQAVALAEAQSRLAALEEADQSITELERSLEELEQSLKPREQQLQEAEDRCSDCRRRKEEAEQRYDRLLAETRQARLQKELVEAYLKRFSSETRLAELRTRLAHVLDLREKVAEVQAELARLPEVSEEDLDTLRDLENKSGRARAALNAMATEIEVLAAEQPVRVGDTDLVSSERVTITDPTEVAAGATRIKVYPGGGDSLAQARERLRALGEELQGMLDRHGLSSLQEAADVVARRKDLAAKEESLKAALDEWDPQGLEQALAEAERMHEAARAEAERRLQQILEVGVPEAGVLHAALPGASATEPGILEATMPGASATEPGTLEAGAPPIGSPVATTPQVTTPASEAEALALLEQAENRMHAAESAEEEARQRRDELREQLARLEADLSASREATTEDKNRAMEWRAQLNLLVANHGTEGVRRRSLAEARGECEEAERKVAATRAAIEALQPPLLEADLDRLERALEETDNQKRAAETRLAVSRDRLRSEGTDDPAADLSSAEARLASAQERLAAVARRAAAIDLIDNLFKQEQQALADQFSRPLAQKITQYLQCLFGQEAEVKVSFDGDSFKKIELVRGSREGATEFSDLSGGAREQVAAAVRLAMAEILAAEHDGSLPVVFDDSFAYSDPERVQTLQRMLDLGSRKGLQIIVLTCNPADYAALGARQVILRAPG